MNLYNKITSRIKEIRQQKNYTQEELSIIAFGEPAKSRINSVELGRRGANIHTIEKILNALGYTLAVVPLEKAEEVERELNEEN